LSAQQFWQKYSDTTETKHSQGRFEPSMKHAPKTIVAFIVLALLGVPRAAPAAVGKIVSVYVKIDDPNCTKIDGNEDEDWATLRCGKPVNGWQTIVDYGDARESISLARNATTISLHFEQFNSGFSSVGPTIEYRVQNKTAVAVVVRHNHSIDPEDASITESVLMIAKLSPSPCVIAAIKPGPQQSATARRNADKASQLPCLQPTP
jgi:hypothetical protein